MVYIGGVIERPHLSPLITSPIPHPQHSNPTPPLYPLLGATVTLGREGNIHNTASPSSPIPQPDSQ